MVKIIRTVAVTFILLLSLSIFEHFFVKNQFNEFQQSLVILYDKIENGNAQKTDGETVQALWLNKKEKLHVIIPHNNISHVDNWLSETIGLIETKNYDLALSKVNVLIDSCRQIPDTYSLSFENIF